jgi:hypothetical protein
LKIFGIGVNKTGTTSLHHALLRLGFSSLHFGDWRTDGRVRQAIAEGKLALTYIDGYDAYSDIDTLTSRFGLLDRQYPGSKFILTTRTLQSWLASRRRHVERNIELARRGAYEGTWLDVDLARWTTEFENHHERVHRHFDGRTTDLLVMDVLGGDGYEKLCPFLDLATLEEPFPTENPNPHESDGLERAALIDSPRPLLPSERAARIRASADNVLPGGARVVVLTRDGDALEVGQSSLPMAIRAASTTVSGDGSDQLIDALEHHRSEGRRFLLIPASEYVALREHTKFCRYVDERYGPPFYRGDSCLIVQLV